MLRRATPDLLVNATYTGLIWELIDRTPHKRIPPKVRRIMRLRSITTLLLFAVAALNEPVSEKADG